MLGLLDAVVQSDGSAISAIGVRVQVLVLPASVATPADARWLACWRTATCRVEQHAMVSRQDEQER